MYFSQLSVSRLWKEVEAPRETSERTALPELSDAAQLNQTLTVTPTLLGMTLVGISLTGADA